MYVYALNYIYVYTYTCVYVYTRVHLDVCAASRPRVYFSEGAYSGLRSSVHVRRVHSHGNACSRVFVAPATVSVPALHGSLFMDMWGWDACQGLGRKAERQKVKIREKYCILVHGQFIVAVAQKCFSSTISSLSIQASLYYCLSFSRLNIHPFSR